MSKAILMHTLAVKAAKRAVPSLVRRLRPMGERA